jgi:hypothetical protein
MRQRLFSAGMVVLLLATLTGCMQADERTRLKEMFVDLVCNYAKKIQDNISKLGSADDQMMKNIKEENDKLQDAMEQLPSKHGFADEKAAKSAMSKYEDDKQFEAEVIKAAKDTCGFDLPSLDSL